MKEIIKKKYIYLTIIIIFVVHVFNYFFFSFYFIVSFFLIKVFSYANASFPYYGTKIGSLKRLHHGVSGDVYAVDSRTIFVKKFNYDGDAPG